MLLNIIFIAMDLQEKVKLIIESYGGIDFVINELNKIRAQNLSQTESFIIDSLISFYKNYLFKIKINLEREVINSPICFDLFSETTLLLTQQSPLYKMYKEIFKECYAVRNRVVVFRSKP